MSEQITATVLVDEITATVLDTGTLASMTQPVEFTGSGFDGVHNDLTGRTADDAHPISAITGLQDALDAAGGGGTSAIPVSLMVLGEGDIATIEADMVGNTPAFSGYVMVGYSVLSTSAGVPLSSIVGEAVAGSGPGLYTWDGTNLTFDRVTVPGDVLAVALTSWVTASPAGLFNGVAFVVDQGPSNPPLAVFQVGAADLVGVDASGFVGNLTSGATDVQLLAAEVDALTLGGGGGIPLSSIGLLDGERNRGYWDAGVADYVAGDVVFESEVWLAVTPATGVPPADPAWTDISARAGLTVELGAAASASGDGSSAIGLAASASGDSSSAIGLSASASGDFSSAVGVGASAPGDGSSAIGAGASASGDSSSAIGVGASASGDGDVNLAHIVTGHVDWSGSPTPDGLVLTPGFADLPVTADATDPATDRKRLIARTDGLYVRDETGTEVGPLGAGGGSGVQAGFPTLSGGINSDNWSQPPGVYGTSTSGLASIALPPGTVWITPFQVDAPITITAAALRASTTAAGAINRCCIAALDTTLQPTSLVYEFATFDTSTAGVKSITGLSVTLPAGLYATYVKSEVATPTLYYPANLLVPLMSGTTAALSLAYTGARVGNRGTTAGAYADPPPGMDGFATSSSFVSFLFLRWTAP